MPDNPPELNLDKAWLQRFLDDDIASFITAVKTIREDGDSPDGVFVPGIPNLQGGGEGAMKANGFHDGQKVPLAIGTMAVDEGDRTNGKYLIGCLNKLVDELDEILKLQVEFFEEIEDSLKDSIEKLFKAQGDNLEKIEGKDFIDLFGGVDEVLSESSGGSNSDSGEEE
ncbi:type VII secretion system-associated protein [Streptomyces sp. SYSU K217416]